MMMMYHDDVNIIINDEGDDDVDEDEYNFYDQFSTYFSDFEVGCRFDSEHLGAQTWHQLGHNLGRSWDPNGGQVEPELAPRWMRKEAPTTQVDLPNRQSPLLQKMEKERKKENYFKPSIAIIKLFVLK